jgi:crotonobetainyl-CoA:carnitine CoA-transferase CaiB-like acyl-CoA transferase
MHPVGPPAGPPLSMPGQQLYDKASIRASAVIQALLLRPGEQAPQNIDISAHEVGTWEKLLHERFSQSARITTRDTNFGPPPGGVWKCSDGYVDIAAHAPRHWNIFLEVIGRPDDLMDPLFEDRGMRVQLFDLLTDLISDHLSTMSAPDIVDRGQAMGLPCALKYTPGEFLEDKQPAVRGFWAQADVPGIGSIRMPGRPYRSTPDMFSFRRGVPALGEHNADIYLQELGHSEDQLQKWAEDGVV